MIYIGIDPGLSGAVAVIDGKSIKFIDTPTELVKKKTTRRTYNPPAMAYELRLIGLRDEVQVGIERQSAMPGQGVSSMFSIGMGFGLWLGIAAGLNMPYTIIEPRAWKKSLMEGMGKEKGASIIRACQLHPKIANDLKLKKHHNRADALLIGEYLRRRMINGV